MFLIWLIWFDFIPLWLNRKFQKLFHAQLGTYQPPIPNSAQASAWSHMYIGRWMRKTEGFPTGLGKNFGRLNGWNIPLAKVVDFVPLGALSGPGAPDPDLARFHIRVKHGILNISLQVCKKIDIGADAIQNASLDKSTGPSQITWL